MTYSYSVPYNQQQVQNPQQVYYNDAVQPFPNYAQKKSALPATAVGAVAGGITGGFVASKKNPLFNKSGALIDSGAKRAFDKYIQNADEAIKNLYTQCKETVQKLSKVTTAEGLKDLINANPEAFSNVDNILDVERVADTNVKSNAKILKTSIKAKVDLMYQDFKNKLQACWDSSAKKLQKPDWMSDTCFDSIKDATKANKNKAFWRSVGIGAGIGGAVLFGLYQLINAKKNNSQ